MLRLYLLFLFVLVNSSKVSSYYTTNYCRKLISVPRERTRFDHAVTVSYRSKKTCLYLLDRNKSNDSSSSSNSSSRSGSSSSSSTNNMEPFYKKMLTIKCPFFRRRAYDILDSISSIGIFLKARHKTISLFPIGPSVAVTPGSKLKHQDWDTLKAYIASDWEGKSYYITGKLSKNIYHDQCLFDGPDPDMPVRGLYKYLSFASSLFNHKLSRADLLKPIEVNEAQRTLTAHWRLEGVLNLPGHPPLKPFTGSTTYHVGDNRLIEKHVETWDISVFDAFISTVFPSFGAPPAKEIDDRDRVV